MSLFKILCFRTEFLLFLCSDVAFRSGPSSMLELQQHDEGDDDIGENSCAMYFKSAVSHFCATKWNCKIGLPNTPKRSNSSDRLSQCYSVVPLKQTII